MTPKLIALTKELHSYFTDRWHKYFLCPDGIPRKLAQFSVADEYVMLDMTAMNPDIESMQYRWHVKDAQTHWKRFKSISQQQAQGHTNLPTVVATDESNGQPLTALVTSEDFLTQIRVFVDPNDELKRVSEGLMNAFEKVATTPTYIEQANAINELGKSIIDIAKVRAQTAKMAVDMLKHQNA